MPKLLQPKTLKKQKSSDEPHEELIKSIGVFDLTMRCNPDPNFVPESYEETYEEWLEEMEYEESLMTPKEKEKAEMFEQKFWAKMQELYPEKMAEMKRLHPDKFKGVQI